MPNLQVSRACRNAVIDRISDANNGFTPRLIAALADASQDIPLGWKLPVVFDNSARNYISGDVAPEDLDSTSNVTYPFVSLFSLRAVNENQQKFQAFSGPVYLGLNVFLSWGASRLLPDFESIADCVEEAVIATFNSAQTIAWTYNRGGLVYNGDISCDRSRLSKDAENWFQTLAFKLTLEVHTAG